ncbi:TetR/AcrR family transcriptional regulator [Isoptericola croceus]|uniref:TetR/AcrR family transcriptional regulator n=1 Tax=Isoptericola croceus TaxID=3031406 RepID=UPI0023F7E5E0|nr:TetR/AcrR family transcriptional regulator [Isoptericola croceus]
MSERTAVRERTRRTLLLAGIEVLSGTPAAPLGEVATRAGVARSTLHRYFSDRKALIAAISDFTAVEYEAAVARASVEDGTGLEAFRRLCLELMESLDILAWWMGAGLTATAQDGESEAAVAAGSDVTDETDEERLRELVARGHDDGTIDPALSAEWVESLLWSNLYACHHLQRSGSVTAFDVRSQALRGLLKAAAADPTRV